MELDISGARIFFTLPIDVPVLGPLRISETMVVSWIVMILITGLCIWLTHDLKEENISKRQAVAELIVQIRCGASALGRIRLRQCRAQRHLFSGCAPLRETERSPAAPHRGSDRLLFSRQS